MPLHPPEIAHFDISKQARLSLFNLSEFALYANLSDKRSVEKQAALYVIRTVLQDDQIEILYRENGKPYLTVDVPVSISHSYDWLAVLFSFNGIEVGVDIEKVRDKILNIKEKFLSPKELEEVKGAPLEKYTVYWCVKEALYKTLGIAGLDFSEQILVEDFSYSQTGGDINADVLVATTKKRYILHYQAVGNYILVYTLNSGE